MVTTTTPTTHPWTMDFAQRLAATRNHRDLTQNQLAERVGVHVSQIRRYEAATSAPGLDILRNIALALNVTTDHLVFDTDERGPDQELALAFEAAQHLNTDDKAALRAVIEGILLRHQARTITQTS